MKVKCIGRGIWFLLTVGKIYEVIREDEKNGYWLLNDRGALFSYSKELFKPLSEVRNEKIDRLLK